MEKTFPGVQVFLSCRDEYMYLLEGQERIISRTSLKENKKNFAYIREIFCDLLQHPVEAFMKESDIPILTELSCKLSQPSSCVLITKCSPPVKTLSGTQINKILKQYNHLNPAMNQPINDFDLVIGVESDELYEAGAQGKMISLIPTGFGKNLFKSMFPWGEILNIE